MAGHLPFWVIFNLTSAVLLMRKKTGRSLSSVESPKCQCSCPGGFGKGVSILSAEPWTPWCGCWWAATTGWQNCRSQRVTAWPGCGPRGAGGEWQTPPVSPGAGSRSNGRRAEAWNFLRVGRRTATVMLSFNTT